MTARAPTAPPDAPPDALALLNSVRRRVEGADQWTLEQWLEELAHLRSLSVRHRLPLHTEHPAVFDLPDGSVGVAPAPTVMRVDPPRPLKIGDTYIGPSLVYPDRPDERIALRGVGLLIPWHRFPALIVSLDGTDEHIRAEVDKALLARAAPRAALPRTTSRAAFTRSLDDPDRPAFRRWRTYRINELAELFVWRESLSKGQRCRYPDHVLGSWIDLEGFTPQKTSDAKKVLRDAIACIPLLLTEQFKSAATAS